jgi:DNA adenine methylase
MTVVQRSWIASRKVRPAVKTHGGKAYLARRIIARLPGHEVFVEAFAGGLSVLLNKRPCRAEVANDLNAALMRFYRTLRARTDELLDRLAPLEYDAGTFAWACRDEGPPGDDLDATVRFIVRNRYSRGGLGRDFAWSTRLRGGQPGDKNAWMSIRAELPRIARRLAAVDLRCQDAFELIRELDGPGTLLYLDPPYHPSTRTARDVFEHDMSEADHDRLLDAIRRCRGAVAISGYHCPPYDDALRGWDRHEFEMPNHSGQGRTKQRRTEVLWVKGR